MLNKNSFNKIFNFLFSLLALYFFIHGLFTGLSAKVGFDEINFDYIRFPAKTGLKFSKKNTKKNRDQHVFTLKITYVGGKQTKSIFCFKIT